MNIKNTGGVAAVKKYTQAGLDAREIARRTGLSLGTVRSYRSFLNKAGGNAHHASQYMSLANMRSTHGRPGRVRRKP